MLFQNSRWHTLKCAWAYGCACFLFSFRSWTWHPSLYPVCSGEDQGRASLNLMARQSHQPGWWIILCLAAWLCIITGPARVQHWQRDSPQNAFPSDNSHFSNTLPAYVSSYGSPFFTFYLFKWKGGFFHYFHGSDSLEPKWLYEHKQTYIYIYTHTLTYALISTTCSVKLVRCKHLFHVLIH